MVKSIGIVGASGDLGSQLTVQACAHFETVYTFDLHPSPLSKRTHGIDPAIKQVAMLGEPIQVQCVDDITDVAEIVHIAAPLVALRNLIALPKSSLLILHDSVMAHSREAALKIKNREQIIGSITIAHCVMNDRRRVIISTDSEDPDRSAEHFTKLGLAPIIMSSRDHDYAMAISQGPMAILHDLLADELVSLEARGLLTPSGRDLKDALTKRAANWTDSTLNSILHNPELPGVLQQMLDKTNNRQA